MIAESSFGRRLFRNSGANFRKYRVFASRYVLVTRSSTAPARSDSVIPDQICSDSGMNRHRRLTYKIKDPCSVSPGFIATTSILT